MLALSNRSSHHRRFAGLFVFVTASALLKVAVPSVVVAQTEHEQILNKLNTIPPSWSKKFGSAGRFSLVFGGTGVLDNETGLVWQRMPNNDPVVWPIAVINCWDLNRGGRAGWRLPTVEELRSLIDPNQTDPALPTGHPFQGVVVNFYWTASEVNNLKVVVHMLIGGVGFSPATNENRSWCVRGGSLDGLVVD